MKRHLQALLCISACVFSLHAFAQRIFYVRPESSGANDGSDWTNAYSKLPDALQRGGTYYIADGRYSRHSFDVPASGEQTITIKKATAADHGADTGWQATFGDGVAEFTAFSFTTDWWVIDGGVREKLIDGCGLKVSDTADRSSLVILSGRTSHITLRYLELAGDPTLQNRATGIYGVHGPSHIQVQYCYLHDFFGVPFHFINAAHVVIEHSLIARNKSTPELHSEGIQARGCTDLIIRENRWEDINGTGVIVSGSGKSSGWRVIGNIFQRGNVGHGIVADNLVDSIEDVEVSGNIIVGHRGNAGMNFYKSKGRIAVLGNVWYDNSWISFGGVTSRDYNHFAKCRFPYAFQPAPHETSVRDTKDGKYSTLTDSPFAVLPSGEIALSRAALQTLARKKDPSP